MIIATAGHVDHGKTTLLQAISGINADRLPEEKRRGMTIDLGYAYWPQPDGRVLGFIDVPGHEKFLANMLAGVGGIDHALLVVACDDGVMAQTREHLAILRLSGRPALTVALTKADRVDEARVEEVRQQLDEELTRQGWQQAPVFVTAAPQSQGIDALRAHLLALRPDEHAVTRRFRLAVDRAFSVKGAGLVVTGTALGGQVAVGDTLWLTGADAPVRVRGLHAQNQPAEQAQAGQRIALNISGDVSKDQVARGDWLLAQKPPIAAERILVALDKDLPIKHWQPLHLHHAASHITGRVSLLSDGLAELILDRPLWLAENDRLVLRDIGARQTLGGARVLSLTTPKRGKRQPEYLAWLAALAQADDDCQVLALHLPKGALDLAAFAWARQLTEKPLAKLLASHELLIAGDRALAQENAQLDQQRLLQVLAEYHQQHADQLGLGRARLRRMAVPQLSEALAFMMIDRLLAAGLLSNTRGWLHLPEHGLAFSAEEQILWARIEPLFGDEAWWVRDLAAELGEDEAWVRTTLRKAAQLGHVTAVVVDRYYLSQRIEQFAALIRELDETQGSANAADFRDRLGVGRKLAIQVLEFFDRSGFTRRKGNQHLLRDSGLYTRHT
ncbi:selenocysteine-specific translation elongation factor [Serratia liquefaciens]|jgi:selenocysteine-specific elongation factor|uniref:selenocysteine-specific translation elongation factor n=1 Tax=Serratia liquefaciens TaxID=614 RepID=UPI000E01FE65|nr:selenocysteine-specific translation elongation factor [Serratia liquefaciens]MBF8107532.1 selenocysteine-specific translation elongation factor [Serratia liquefaciens]MCH4193826.1 selenocysteine-specific translation elongation factor [Serratia liquefaciens]MCH4230981.1 selenocysteine-specific translation elongation factor [Serratia liquefaciens]MCH4262127.1 selenocysteine-specific translation elongation factor [Serratia liquefaciens]MCI1214855.1 selenocysteine-specific translation elongatio